MRFQLGDYTDFYVGLHHAVNCGRLLRGPGQELQPNYKHLPVGYHGRASSVVISGTPITRPSGQIRPPGSDRPLFSASKRLDFELELGCFVARPNEMGKPLKLEDANEHLFGVVLLNDWSARDIQAWEMVPLGPFNAKNFGTSISPWVVTMEALEPFLVKGLESEKPLLDYLKGDKETMVPDISLQVQLKSKIAIFKPFGFTNIRHSTKRQARIGDENKFEKSLVLISANACPPYRRWMSF
jgi:fumarylacetoacetase